MKRYWRLISLVARLFPGSYNELKKARIAEAKVAEAFGFEDWYDFINDKTDTPEIEAKIKLLLTSDHSFTLFKAMLVKREVR